MALRMTIDGVKIVGAPQDVAEVILALKALKGHSKSIVKPSPVQRTIAHSVAHPKPDPSLFRVNEISGKPHSLTGNHREALMALKEAFPNGVSSDQIASRIGKSRTSIPIIIVSLNTYGKKLGLDPKHVIVRTKAERGKKGSIYTLTEKAMRVFF